MKNFKKILALVLSLIVAMAIFAGCGPKRERAEEALGEELTWEEKFGGETVTLTWCFPDARGVIDYGEWDRIQNAVNEITVREINTRIDIELIPLGEYTEKMSLKYAADEPWDIAFCGTQWNSYPNAVSQEVLEPLNYDYMRTYMPETMAMLDQRYFNALTINGQLYGVPLQQIYVRQNGIRFEIDWAEELGFDWASVKDFEDLEPYFDTLLANGYTECFMGAGEGMMENIISYMGFDTLIGSAFPGVIRVTDEGCKVVNQYESEEFKYIAGLMQKWFEKGYFTDGVMFGGQDNYNFTDVDRNPVSLEPVVKPGGDAMATMKLDNGVTIKTVPIGDPAVLTTSSIMQTTMVVSANTTHPGRALAFINLLNTNEELVNLLCYGQKDIDWKWKDEANKLIEIEWGAYPGNEAFFVGNSFLTYHVHESQIGCWDETKKINSEAKTSPLLGFTFDASPVRAKVAAINGYIDAYLEPVLCGMGEGGSEAAIANLNKFLYDNGLQDILNEMQRQIDAWLASK